MSDHEWHDITRYNLVMPQESVIKLYNIKSISHHYRNSFDKTQSAILKEKNQFCYDTFIRHGLMSLVSFIVIVVTFIICHSVDFIKKFSLLEILSFQIYLMMGCHTKRRRQFLKKTGIRRNTCVLFCQFKIRWNGGLLFIKSQDHLITCSCKIM